MKIAIKDLKSGKVYSNDMSAEEGILEIHFCTSYTQVIVQDVIEVDGKKRYPKHDVILPPLGSESHWIDLIATQNDPQGEWVTV